MNAPRDERVSAGRIVQALLWLAVWIGGLWYANSRYQACQGEGVAIPGCSRMLENLGWAAALFGLVMLTRTLYAMPFLKRWLGD